MSHTATKFKAIPTKYKDRLYRSRLEARWAAMFDLLNWSYEYEPCDFNGWIPDFVITGTQTVYVEVKPYFQEHEWSEMMMKIENSDCKEDVLLLGATLPQNTNEKNQLGWLGEYNEHYTNSRGFSWGAAILGIWGNGYKENPKKIVGFSHDTQSFTDRITGFSNDCNYGNSTLNFGDIQRLWQMSANTVQWASPSHSTQGTIKEDITKSFDPDTFDHSVILKPSAAIAVSGKIGAPARRIFNVLYQHAFDNLEAKDHVIALPTLIKAIGDSIPSYTRLGEHLETLVSTTLEWNILGKDNREWLKTGLLAKIHIDKDMGLLTYEFPRQLREKERKIPYAKLNVRIQNSIDSSHSLALYELTSDYFNENLGKGETSWIPLSLLQNLLGTDYADWGNIQRRLINEPLERLQNLNFTINAETKRRGRKIVAVKFTMKRRNTPQ